MKNVVGIKQELLLSRIGEDATARRVMALLTTARRIDAACAELLAQHDLSEGRLAALLAISAESGLTPRTLSDRLDVTSATVTGLLDRLDRDGLIRRSPHATDRRTHTLATTPSAEQLLATLAPVYADWLQTLEIGIAAPERELAADVFATVQLNLATGTRDD